MKKNILITGGTGFVGKSLTKLLLEKGYTVSILSRDKKKSTADIYYYTWNLETFFIEEEAILKADYIVHLAGENIAAERWSAKRKKQIVQSRVQTTDLLYNALKGASKKPEAFISASGIGIYGAKNGMEICTEKTPAANDFLGVTCQLWESATVKIAQLNIRCAQIRTGLVIGKDDGFLKKLAPVFKFRLGAVLGSGKQYMPWIHVEDLCAIYLSAIENSKIHGAYNAAVLDTTTNKIFTKTLASLFGYKVFLPAIPTFFLKFILGDLSQVLLTGRRVSPDKIVATGFKFSYTNLKKALQISI